MAPGDLSAPLLGPTDAACAVDVAQLDAQEKRRIKVGAAAVLGVTAADALLALLGNVSNPS
eukprot:CAMPEP_0184532248 /NCGR_PEP_ID=MMETSP0198_2-20121128/14053_1 /TAXON_ID=1112570 /ORGANISM="Thraustochytrium sp., Strain LLF1b" /LENGTH=60 /DNA_ID=CAMNT_0026924807 /DNA_START=38 /DNA_END=217 /DNA_ORIENTATION=+